MEKKKSRSLLKRDPENPEVYKAEFIEEIPVSEVVKKKETEPASLKLVKTIGNLGSLAFLFFKTFNSFKGNSDGKRKKNRIRLRKRRNK